MKMNGLYNLEIFDVELMLYSELPGNIQVKASFKRHSLHVGRTLSVERRRTRYFIWQYVKIIIISSTICEILSMSCPFLSRRSTPFIDYVVIQAVRLRCYEYDNLRGTNVEQSGYQISRS